METEAEVSREIRENLDKMMARKIDAPEKITKECGNVEQIALVDNAEYRLLGVKTLTFEYSVEEFACWIGMVIAQSGDVAVTFPKDTKYIGSAPTFANGEMWELSIKDGVVIAQKLGDGT